MENMPSGGGGYGEQYGEYAFWGGMEHGMENMPSGGVWRTVWRICLLGGGMENSMENMPSRGGMENSMENSLLRGGLRG